MPLFFWGGRFAIFVLRSKRTDMLNGITWGQFLIFIGVAVGAYYVYIFLAYYGAEVRKWLGRKAGANRDNEVGPKGNGNVAASSEPEPKATGGQAELFVPDGPATGQDEQFQVMQRVFGMLRQVIMQGIENKLDRGNLLDHIHEVLRENRQLWKTEYAETINNFLVRVCSSELSLELGEAELAELWK